VGTAKVGVPKKTIRMGEGVIFQLSVCSHH